MHRRWFVIISIHAPAKGATCFRVKIFFNANISIHAPAKGATPHHPRLPLLPKHFNPRSREGSDTARPHMRPAMRNFNPRSREGSDAFSDWIDDPVYPFQSTLPRRERRIFPMAFRTFPDFNPRSREGSDMSTWTFPKTLKISIHAPAKGATGFDNVLSVFI